MSAQGFCAAMGVIMRNWMVVLLVPCMVAAGPTDVQTPEEAKAARQLLLSAKTLHCDFTTGSFTEFEGGKQRNPKPSEAFGVVFDGINHDGNSARIVGNAGASDVRTTLTVAGITFEELTPTGNMIVTTVAAYRLNGENRFPAAMSRHIKVEWGAMFSQLVGTCRVSEQDPLNLQRLFGTE